MNNLSYYHAFGLNIASTHPILYMEYAAITPVDESQVDVHIRFGKTPNNISNGIIKNSFTVSRNEILFKIDNIGSYHIKDGRYITVNPECDFSTDKLYVFIVGSCMGAILRQRNILALHSGCVYNGEYAVLFMGKSGAGKSTITAEFVKKDWKMVTDDIAPVTTDEKACYVTAGLPMQRLWDDSIENLNISTKQIGKAWRIDESKVKYIRDANSSFINDKVNLKHIVLLKKHAKDKIIVRPFDKKNAIRPLMNNVYRGIFYTGKDGISDKLRECTAISTKVQFWQVLRSEHHTSAQVTKKIIEALEQQ